MPKDPATAVDYPQQVAQTHAQLINHVVAACHNSEQRKALEQPLKVSEQNGWTELVSRIRRILQGERGTSLLSELDAEDHGIITAILQGLVEPGSLPDPKQNANPSVAAPGLAQIIQAARSGDVNALQIAAGMAEQMTRAGGDMASIGGIMKRLIDGERDLDLLTRGMPKQAQDLTISIVNELAALEPH